MGLEYRIPFNFPEAGALHQVLRDAPYFVKYDNQYDLYEYRAHLATDPARMPDATAAVRKEGFYFCEYGDQRVAKGVLSYLRSHVEASGQAFVVEDLE